MLPTARFVEAGTARVQMGPSREDLSFDREVGDDWVILVPAGTWHNVTNIGDNGELTVTRIGRHGTVTLPTDYVKEHVRLGYLDGFLSVPSGKIGFAVGDD